MNNLLRTSTNTNWYLLYTFPNSEKKVCNYLSSKKIETFLPLQKIVKQWSDRKKTIETPLFPNYIFVYTKDIDRYKALDTPGVVRYVSCEGRPVLVCPEQINLIRKIVNVSNSISVEGSIKRGDTVRLTSGPFAGLEGVLFDKKGSKRFGVMIPTIDKMLSIEICSSCIEKV